MAFKRSGVRLPLSPPYEKHRFDTNCVRPFSLQIGTFILSATKFQSLVEVSNGISMRLFFFLDIATERSLINGTIGIVTERLIFFYKISF